MRLSSILPLSFVFGACLAIAGLLILCSPALAGTTHEDAGGNVYKNTITGNEADFSLDLAYHGPANQLTVTITNTSASSTASFLTGFVFDIDRRGYVATLASASDSDFKDLRTSHHTDPLMTDFGFFQAGAALGALFGWSPVYNGGLAAGETGTFTFDISGRRGRRSSRLKASDFFSDGFVVAFFNNGQAVQGPAGAPGSSGTPPPTGPGSSIPLPSAVWAGLLGMAMAGGILALRRRRECRIGCTL